MKSELKDIVRQQVQAGMQGTQSGPAPKSISPVHPAAVTVESTMVGGPPPPKPADDLIIEITGPDGIASITLRPFEVSRLRGRFGRGPGFEKWVAARVRDAMIAFGGG